MRAVPSISSLLSMLHGKSKILTSTLAHQCLKIPVLSKQRVVTVARKVSTFLIHFTTLSLVHFHLPRPAPPQLPSVLFVQTMGMNVARHRRATTSMAVVHHLLLRRVHPVNH